MIKPKLIERGGATHFGVEAEPRDLKEWPATVTQVRDVILTYHIAGPDFSSWVGSNEAIARDYAPTEDEVERTNDVARDAVVYGRMIDFGMLPNDVIKNGGNRGGPLWNMGAIGMPWTSPWVMYHAWEQGVCVYLVNPRGDSAVGSDFEVCELLPMIVGGDKLLIIADRGLFIIRPDGLPHAKYDCRIAPSTIRWLEGYDNGGKNNPMSAAAANIGDPVMAGLMILNTRNVERETVRVPDKLNKARTKNGKPPIPPYDRVNAAPYVTAIMMRGKQRERSEGQGGTHASPVPHLRMGHPRTYADGRSIFIRDTLVNVTDDRRAEFLRTRSHYTVRQ